MKQVFRHLKRLDLFCVLGAMVFIAAQVRLDLKLPDYMTEIALLVRTPGGELGRIWAAGGKMLVCALGSLVAAVIAALFTAKLAAHFGASLRGALFDKVLSLSTAEVNRFSAAGLITRTTSDVTQVQMLIALGLQASFKAPITAVWAIFKMSAKSQAWALSTASAAAILLVCAGIGAALVLPRFKQLRKSADELNRVTGEHLSGLRDVRACNGEDCQQSKFDRVGEALTSADLYTGRVMSFLMPTVQLVMNRLNLAIFWLGAVLIGRAGMAERIGLFSDMMVFSQYAMQLAAAFMTLAELFVLFPRAMVSVERIAQVLDTGPALRDGPAELPPGGRRGTVEFRHVSFRYPDAEEEALHDISFTAGRGETVAFIGAAGSGKSTLAQLVPRFYDATEGHVLVDGVDVRAYRQTDLRNKIGYVSRPAVLFSGTVRSNVAFGTCGKAMEGNVVDAVYTAQAAEFVEQMDGGYDAPIARRGANLSGGQRQRLSIARAVCRDPEILIFDDAFSDLDEKTIRELRRSITADCKGCTKLIVAQRIAAIRDADRILVLEDGRIVGMGTHGELLERCEVYRQIARSQLPEEELGA